MSTLTLNSTFGPEIFVFEMLPPYVVEKQHEIQNGDLLIDIIAYKDQFQIIWPWLSQTEYNNLMTILYNLTDPYLTVEYVTDSLTRIWDSSTAYSPVSAYFSAIPVYANNGILSEMVTTNLFIDPSAESGGTGQVVAEDSEITVTNSLNQSLYGSRSFKATNSNSADYEPINAIGTRGYVASVCRDNHEQEKSLGVSTGAKNVALYTDFSTGNADNGVWTYNNLTKITSGEFPITLAANMGMPDSYMEQIVTTGIGTSYIFQVSYKSLNVEGSITVEARDSSNTLITSTTVTTPSSAREGYIIAAVSFTATTATTKCRLVINNWIDFPSFKVQEWMLCDMTGVTLNADYYSIFTGTDAVPVDEIGNFKGFAYEATKSMYGAFPTNLGARQSVACWFKTSGWDYNNSNGKKYTLFSSVLSTTAQPDTEVYFLDGNLYIYQYGSQALSYDVSSLDSDSWHHLCIVMGYDSNNNNLKIYLDFTLISTLSKLSKVLLGNTAYSNATGMFLLGNSAYYSGAVWTDNTYGGTTKHFEGFIDNFVVTQYEMDKHFSYKDASLLDLMSNTSFTFNNVITKNEEISFYNQGDSEDAYVARTIYFSVAQDISVGSASLNTYFEDTRHKKLLLVGRCHNLSSYYVAYYEPWAQNSRGYVEKVWHRLYLDVITVTGYAIFNGVFGLSIPIGDTAYIDGVQVEATKNSSTYCDGDQINCSWTGTENASTSIRGNQTLYATMPSSLVHTYSENFAILLKCYVPSVGWNTSLNSPGNIILNLAEPGKNSAINVSFIKNTATTRTFTIKFFDIYGDIVYSNSINRTETINRDDLLFVGIQRRGDYIDLYINGNLEYTLDIKGYQFEIPERLYMGSLLASTITNINVTELAIYNTHLEAHQMHQAAFCGADIKRLSGLLEYYNFNDTLELSISSDSLTNNDVQRLRKKVLRQSIASLAHVKNRANFYSVKVTFRES